MAKKHGRICALALSASLLISSVGCSRKSAITDEAEYLKTATYPIETDTMLTYWLPLHQNVAATATQIGETPYAEEMEKRTGVTVKYIHPVTGQDTEQLNLLLASDELPDMIEYNWNEFSGGPNKAMSEGYITELNDLIDKYSPNLRKRLSENEEFDKEVKTDEGKYYAYPFARSDDLLLNTAGLVIRADYLDECGLEIPKTFDEFYNVLRVLKEKKNLPAPLTISGGAANNYLDALLAHFGATNSFYTENGEIKYGPLEKEYKEAVMLLRKFYAEGLLDSNFATADLKVVDSNMLSGKSAVTYASAGQQLGKWTDIKESEGEEFDLVAMAHMVKAEGIENKFVGDVSKYPGSGNVAITAKSANKALAAKYLDYLYGEEGHLLVNFGIEGESYEMVDGKPVYTELIMKNPDGLTVNQAMGKYFRASYSGPFIQDRGYIEQYYQKECQKEAQRVWGKNISIVKKYSLPQVIPSEEESTRMAKILANIDSYKYTMLIRFINGMEDISNFDTFIARLKEFGIEEAIAMQQSALERYKKR